MGKGQGISINVIVIAAIALIILVILSTLVIRSSGGLNRQANTCGNVAGESCEFSPDPGCNPDSQTKINKACVDFKGNTDPEKVCCLKLS